MLETLLELAIPHEDIDGILTTTIPASLKAQFDEHVAMLQSGHADLPKVHPEGAPLYYFVLVFVEALPYAKALHRERGIPDRVSRLTLSDLGRHLAVYRRRLGKAGLDTGDWLSRHFQGRLYQLGRLQFEQVTLGGTTGGNMRAAGLPYGPGDPVLSIHIPEFCGPFTPAAIDESLAAAVPFFARHFPEVRYEVAVCHSWLLDPALSTVFGPESNILAFQRRFTHSHAADSDEVLRFITVGTRLHKAMSEGGPWHTGSGWLLLE